MADSIALTHPMASPKQGGNRIYVLCEVVAFMGLAVASKALLSLVAWKYAGPISLIGLLGILTLYLHRIGFSWRDFGLTRLPDLKARLLILPQALLVFGGFAIAISSVLGLGQALGWTFMSEVPEGVMERWGAVEGNLPLYLMWLGIIWTSAAFGEEMFFRGYLVTRFTHGFSGTRLAPILAIVFAAAFFGFGHMYYQGLRGFITTGAIALVFGASFLLFKRNLWPIILVHGVIDTLTFTALFLGLE